MIAGVKDNSILLELVKSDNTNFEFQKGKETFHLQIKLNETLSVILKLKFGVFYEGIFTFDELIKNKILRVCDNMNEILDMLLKKIQDKKFSFELSENIANLIFEYNLESKTIPLLLMLTKNSEADVSSILQEVLHVNSKLEERVDHLEKKLEEMSLNFKKLEEKLSKQTLENKSAPVPGCDNLLCWQCGATNNGSFRIKPYLKNDGRKDQFVVSGQWGVCLKCDPNNTYTN